MVIGTAMALAGCSAADSAGGDGDYMDDDLPMGNCSAGSGGSCPDTGNVPAGFPCGGTLECTGDLACVATFQEGEVGEFTCSAQCIPNDDEAWWCIDAGGCCDPTATCSPRGLCIVPDGLDDTAADPTMSTIGDGTGATGSTGVDPTGGDSSGSGSESGTADSSSGESGSGSGSSTGGA